MRPVCLLLASLSLGICPSAGAQESAPKEKTTSAAMAVTKRGQDEKAIADLVAAFAKAFNDNDAAAAAATFADDALVVDERGERTEGRVAIRAQLTASFAGSPRSTIAIKVNSLRFLGPDTALEEGQTTITPAGVGAVPEITRFTVVYIKKNGQWLQSAVRDEHSHDLSPHDRLKELEWLVGDWINESQDAVVNTSCKWSDDGNFLIRDFTMKTQGQPVLSGTQRIGWDAVKRQFKTWIFDSQGGFGDGYWTKDGDRWLIKADGVRQDGQPASATNIVTRMGRDRIGWQSVDRTLGGAAIAGIDEFTLVRKPPAPGK
jgi:uncharacterized protein (TIGR02246 family)